MIAHRFFHQNRVTKTDSKDGKTEWFLLGTPELESGLIKLSKALHYIYKDEFSWIPPQLKLDKN